MNTQAVVDLVQEPGTPAPQPDNTVVQAAATSQEGVAANTPAENIIKVGFRNKMNEFHPEWETVMSESKIDHFREFYLAGVRDASVMTQFLVTNIVEIENERQAKLQSALDALEANIGYLTNDPTGLCMPEGTVPVAG